MKTFNKISIGILAVVFTLSFAGQSMAATTINLGTADGFAVLAGSGITNTGATTISGDVGTYPTLTQTGFSGGNTVTITGTNHVGDVVTQGAKTDLTTAYNAAVSSTPATTITSDLGTFNGGTLTPGVYNSGSSIGLTGTLTLDAQGDSNAVFIFQAGSTLTTASASHVTLINGAQACNVFWQVGSSATLGTTSDFKGNILAFSSITDNGGSTINGRLLARNALVTLNNSTVIKATCVVPPTPPVISVSGGASPQPVPPLINVVKVPSPLVLSAGPGGVVYDYTVSNVGTVAMSNVTVNDNKCSLITFISGDTNNDSKLDVNETWKYRCTTNLSETTTNTVLVSGQANGLTTIDTANATVVVSAAIVPPLIHVVKKPSTFLLSAGGGAVTYTYTITNPGTEPLNTVSVIDDKCTGLPGRVVGHPGDLNHNDLLESNETWTFTCQSNLTQTTTNTATAEGMANGLTAIDYALATVVVAPPAVVVTPTLPNTGFSPTASASDFGQQVKAIAMNLGKGSRGTGVSVLQQFLISQNKGSAAQALADVGATAYFGVLTRAALAEFQKVAGINPPLGNFGPITRSYLSTHY